eukprot:CAMPEP_0184052112 /NCGR_PEP_ID=MMETSP0956-20121227/5102_1 /TAXON_ID=627963 /ORGANISM="Aplanochytrium sp, Strain PBS07" /LENGTH=472 /DNA_ID=CAMNT_0026345113 /DNA_START=101 /DNA_END=1519 /DNA_ORIENTATION=+
MEPNFIWHTVIHSVNSGAAYSIGIEPLKHYAHKDIASAHSFETASTNESINYHGFEFHFSSGEKDIDATDLVGRIKRSVVVYPDFCAGVRLEKDTGICSRFDNYGLHFTHQRYNVELADMIDDFDNTNQYVCRLPVSTDPNLEYVEEPLVCITMTEVIGQTILFVAIHRSALPKGSKLLNVAGQIISNVFATSDKKLGSFDRNTLKKIYEEGDNSAPPLVATPRTVLQKGEKIYEFEITARWNKELNYMEFNDSDAGCYKENVEKELLSALSSTERLPKRIAKETMKTLGRVAKSTRMSLRGSTQSETGTKPLPGSQSMHGSSQPRKSLIRNSLTASSIRRSLTARSLSASSIRKSLSSRSRSLVFDMRKSSTPDSSPRIFPFIQNLHFGCDAIRPDEVVFMPGHGIQQKTLYLVQSSAEVVTLFLYFGKSGKDALVKDDNESKFREKLESMRLPVHCSHIRINTDVALLDY